jgi:hypothetical protein
MKKKHAFKLALDGKNKTLKFSGEIGGRPVAGELGQENIQIDNPVAISLVQRENTREEARQLDAAFSGAGLNLESRSY